MKTKWFLMVALLALSLILASCGPTETATPSPTPSPAATTAVPETVATVAKTIAVDEAPTEPAIVEPGMCEMAPLPILPLAEVDEAKDHVKGASADKAKLTIVEYSDFLCPGCAGIAPVLTQLVKDHPDIRVVYRHFPLDFHENADLAAEASEAAGAQGKFWEMHDQLFATTSEWGSLPEEEFRTKLTDYATVVGLDVAAFNKALDDGTYTEMVEAQYQESQLLGLPGTPSFIFNGVLFPSDIGLSYDGLLAFRGIIDNQDSLFFDAIPEMTVDEADEYQATFKTSKGDIVVKLFPKDAPVFVNNFLFLAKEKWYNGSDFFFVEPNFVAVSGDPSNTTVGYPGYYCTGEVQGSFADAGWMGMLPNGQFFFSLGSDAGQLDGTFVRIGQVTEGLDVLQSLAPVSPAAGVGTPDVLETVEIN
ncbi:MAG: thioredoxin domain-containing protein [Anaerolineae bacterium]|nr:thioredoxin domain-containing protein [Anaerolineae bacterium]